MAKRLRIIVRSVRIDDPMKTQEHNANYPVTQHVGTTIKQFENKTKQKRGKHKQTEIFKKNESKEAVTSRTDGWNETGGILERKPDDNAS